DLDATRGLRDRARALRSASLEELGDTRQTLRDVVGTGSTTLVEGTHRELRSGLTDRLGGDDADRLADVDELSGRERTAVAGGADADRRLAGEHRAHLDGLDAGLDERVDQHVAHVGAGRGHHGALGVDRVLGEGAREHRVLDVLVAHQLVADLRRDPDLETLRRAAVVLTDDDILRDVDETTREVARVRGTQSGVGETLTGTVRGDEVLRHTQTLAVRGDDRTSDRLTLRVGDEATDTRDVSDLQPVTTGARRHHPVDVVVLRVARLHGLGDLVGRVGPDVDELLAARRVVDETLVVLGLDLRGLLLVLRHDRRLVLRRDDVRERDGHARTRGPVEARVLDAVERGRDLHLGVALGEIVDDRRDLALVGERLDVPVVGRERLVEQGAAERGLDELARALHEALRGILEVHALAPAAHPGLEVEGALVLRQDRLGDRRERAALADGALGEGRQVVQTDDHVLAGQGHRAAVRRRQGGVRGEHEDAFISLLVLRRGKVHAHWV